MKVQQWPGQCEQMHTPCLCQNASRCIRHVCDHVVLQCPSAPGRQVSAMGPPWLQQPTRHVTGAAFAQEAYDSGLGVESLSLETLNGAVPKDATVLADRVNVITAAGVSACSCLGTRHGPPMRGVRVAVHLKMPQKMSSKAAHDVYVQDMLPIATRTILRPSCQRVAYTRLGPQNAQQISCIVCQRSALRPIRAGAAGGGARQQHHSGSVGGARHPARRHARPVQDRQHGQVGFRRLHVPRHPLPLLTAPLHAKPFDPSPRLTALRSSAGG